MKKIEIKLRENSKFQLFIHVQKKIIVYEIQHITFDVFIQVVNLLVFINHYY